MTQSSHHIKAPKVYTLSIRLTAEEKARLEEQAGNLSKSAYVKLCLFGKNAPKIRTRHKHVVKDQSTLSRILAKLGATRLAANMNQIAHAANCGALVLNPELQALLSQACADIREIKALLMKALGFSG